MIIEKLTEDDIYLIDQAFEAQGWPKRTHILHDYLKQQEINERIVLVAKDETQVMGYVTLVYEAKNGPFKDQKIPEIMDLNVFESYQGRKISHQLLKAVEKVAFENYDIITIGVGLHKGYGKAQRLYIKNGYQFDGSGLWYQNRQLDINEPLLNNDDCALYLYKKRAQG